jgi:UTP--glucose-1-phosphate uridylyltransferase
VRWCFVSNADNLGAVPDARLAAWVAAEGVPFAMEAVRGTPPTARAATSRATAAAPCLRETAQVPPGDDSFTDVERWRCYNTNNLWIDLEALRALQAPTPAAPRCR